MPARIAGATPRIMLQGRTHPLLLPALLVALLGALVAAPAASAAAGVFGASAKKMRIIPAKHVSGATATFRLNRARAMSCRAARVRVGDRMRRVAARRVRAAASRQTIRVRLSRPERRAARRAKPRLVIYARRKLPGRRAETLEATQPAPSAPATDSPATTGDPVPAETEAPATPPVEAVAEAVKSTTRPAGSPVMSDTAAAALVQPSGAETRPENTAANQRVPTATELEAFRAANSSLHAPHEQLVTGNFTGTTDEIIQWAAWKWGIDEDVFRAQAVVETWWRADFIGDNGESFGLFQIKRTVHLGTHPLSAESTAFNADYVGAIFRYYYDGHAGWLMDVEHGQPYSSGDMWGSLGAHYAGRWWTAGAQTYIEKLQRRLAERTWAQPSF